MLLGFGWMEREWILKRLDVQNRMMQEMKQRTGLSIQLGQTPELSLWPNLNVVLKGVSVFQENNKKPVAQADLLHVGVSWASVISPPVRFTAIKAQQVTINASETPYIIDQINVDPKDEQDYHVQAQGAAWSSEFDMNYQPTLIKLNQLVVKSPWTHATGHAEITLKEVPNITFDLAFNKTDVSGVLATPKDDASDNKTSQQAPVEKNAAPLNLSFLKNFSAQGHLSIDTLVLPQATLDDLNVTLDNQKGLVHLSAVTAKIYGGDYQGNMQLDATRMPYTIQGNHRLKQVDLLALLKQTAKFEKLTGRLNLNTTLNTSGSVSNDFKNNAIANGTFSVDNGVYVGLDLGHWWQVGEAMVQGKVLASAQALGNDTGKTPFDTLAGDFSLQKQIINSKHLLMVNSTLKADGQGSTSLVDQRLNYLFNITHGDQVIPLDITGTAQSPKVMVDPSFLRNVALKQVGNKLKQNLGISPDDSTDGQKKKEQLQNMLKGVLGQ